ncbi:hypothetical protein [Haloplanus aerogenes]|uniref:Uncharacterized protein n=1 Tax=Haloplanus aerogenes TaxID=660522 RepID=A0A3M0DTI2_9EURY|nr:hypothetical protein [Haloplanus aerogenes]AZH25569.1 hypothetical protein DU502_09315 [Haloplanus aerogenes]RMB25285.1 hypothetical protein ATH50_0370 [Haloplanus aerogenes]
MSRSTPTTDDSTESIHCDYILGVRIVERTTADGDTVYRFEAPHHGGLEFDDPETAELYADVYFDVNGFDEEKVGEEGVPPAIIQAGRDTLAAYFLTQSYGDLNWVASYYGIKPERAERLVNRVRKRAKQIRDGAAERGMV